MKIIFKGIVGSQAYGTSTPASDIDIKGVYIQPIEEVLGFKYKEQVNVSKDECYYEVKRFLELCMSANPTMLELLFLPEHCILEQTEEWKLIKAQAEMFITKKCLNSFGGYAVQQIEKAKGLNKKMNWEQEKVIRKTPLDFCYMYQGGIQAEPLSGVLEARGLTQGWCGLANIDHIRDGYALFYDWKAAKGEAEPLGYKGVQLDDSNSVRSSEIPKGEIPLGLVYYNKDAYTQHCKAYQQYETWLRERNTARYVDSQKHGQKIDGKNLMHCRRLLDMAKEIATLKQVKVLRENKDYLLSIRRGEVVLEDIIATAQADIKELDTLFARSNLPESVDSNKVEQLLLILRGQ